MKPDHDKNASVDNEIRFDSNKASMMRLVFVMLGLFHVSLVYSQVFINEFMASNNSTIVDPDQVQYVDWIELYNAGNEEIDIGHWYFKNRVDRPDRWQIPEGSTIAAGGHLLFWADGTDIVSQGFHTDFKLDVQGEYIGLYDVDDIPIDFLAYPEQVTDVSYGRSPDGDSDWAYFMNPTPGQTNGLSDIGVLTFSPVPQYSLASGFFNGSQSPELSSAYQNAVIRYTLDGSTPKSASILYTEPILVQSTTVIRARTYRTGSLPSETVTRTYFINEAFTLPVISLTTEPKNLWHGETGIYVDEDVELRKEWERPARIEYFDKEGRFGFDREADIRLFGRSAIFLPQKSLGIFLNEKLEYPLFQDRDLDGYHSFILRSSSDDWSLTLFRDGMMQSLLKKNFIIDRQAYQPAILFLNGAYWGIHNIREKYNEDYLSVHHDIDRDNLDLLYVDYRTGAVDILRGDADRYDELLAYMNNNDMSSQQNYETVKTLMDMDNFVDYIIAQVFLANWSWSHNVRMWRPRTESGKWHWLIFDLDRGFTEADLNMIVELREQFPIFSGLIQNDGFKEKLISRFDDHMNLTLQPDRMIFTIDSIKALIEPAMPRHIDKWQFTEGSDFRGIQSMDDWDNHVNRMIDFANRRHSFQRQNLIGELGINGTAEMSLSIAAAGGGHILLDEAFVVKEDFTGTFFTHIPMVLKAIPTGGYRFLGWGNQSASNQLIIQRGAEWKYLDDGSDQGNVWIDSDYDGSDWASGLAQLGYGDGDESTVVSYGADAENKFVTTYFRKTFLIGQPDDYLGFILKILFDDGVAVYLNGQEVGRLNLPPGPLNYLTFADSTVSEPFEKTFFQISIDADRFMAGQNILAAEIHQCAPTSSDISFDFELEGITKTPGTGKSGNDEVLTVTLTQDTVITALFDIIPENVLPRDLTADQTLTIDQSPYVARGDVTIFPHVTLSADPGVEIRMPEDASMIVQGRLLFQGSESRPIVLKAHRASNRWGAICFDNPTDPSLLNYVHVEGCSVGKDTLKYRGAISADHANVTLDHVTIVRVFQPIFSDNSHVTIVNSRIDGSDTSDDIINIVSGSASIENNDLFGNGELDFDFVDNGIIKGNRITNTSLDPNRDGIDIGGSKDVLIQENWIMNCPDKGISIGEFSTATLQKNVILNCNLGVAVKDNSSALIDHNTFYNNQVAVSCFEKNEGMGGGHVVMTNSILSESADADYTVDALSSVMVSYSLSDGGLLPGEGNLFANPLFLKPSENNFRLLPGSPCIDAGVPDGPLDPDGTRTDLGAFYYHAVNYSEARLTINELLASNDSWNTDEAGEYDDWFEIYNGSEFSVDIGNLYVTDDLTDPTKWRVPTTHAYLTTIPPDSFLMIWADGEKDQGPLHAEFSLSASGEDLGLVHVTATDIVFIDSVRFGQQSTDISFGRFPDGDDDWIHFRTPTPGSTNSIIDPPVIHLISPENDTSIQYIDGSEISLRFTWTPWHSPVSSDSLLGYDFRLKDNDQNTVFDSTVDGTLLLLSFIPEFLPPYQWYVLAKDTRWTITSSDTFRLNFETASSTDMHNQKVPHRFVLYQNFPNPFNQSTLIRFDIPRAERVQLIIYDMMGRIVHRFKNEILPVGFHHLIWEGTDESGNPVSTGIYFCKMVTDSKIITKKMIIMR